ncbi:hypothetical protein ACLB2K_033199 [Fragaria x ananassa]
MRATLVELSNFHKVRQASSLALNNVWHALEMELRLCKMQIPGLEKACNDEKRRLGLAEQELQSMRYHP